MRKLVQGQNSVSLLLCFFFPPDFLSTRAFVRALLFVKSGQFVSGQFVNTARVDPALLVVENSRLRVWEKNMLAI